MVRFHPGEPAGHRRPSGSALVLLTVGLMVLAAGSAVLLDAVLVEPETSPEPRHVEGLGQIILLAWLYGAKPVAAALGAAVVVACWLVRRRLGLLALVVLLVPNVVVQLVKHVAVLQAGVLGSLNPLSGHAALFSSVCLTWLAFAPPRRKGWSALCAAVAIGGVLLGVTAVWHSVAQVTIPLAVSVVVVLAATWAVPRAGAPLRRWAAVGTAAGCAVAAAALSTTFPARAVPSQLRMEFLPPTQTLTVLLAVVAAVTAVLAGATGRGLPDADPTGLSPARAGGQPGPAATGRSARAAAR